MESLFGLDTYTVGNRDNPRGIIVIYSDIFGLELVNNKLIADAYAKSGEWLVYLPDFFKGDPVPLAIADIVLPVDKSKQTILGKYTGMLANAPSFLAWRSRHPAETATKDCMEFLEALRRATPKTQRIGIVGFCYGGKYALQAGLEKHMIQMETFKVPLVDAVVALHPSRLAIPEDVKALVVPTAFGWGLEDTTVKIEQKSLIENLHANVKSEGLHVPEMEHKVYKPGRHGFAVRGNPDDPLERACLEESEAQTLQWFGRWLLS